MKVIDVHVHPLVKEALEHEPELLRWQMEVYGLTTAPQPLETLESQLREAGVEKAVLLALDCRGRWGCCIPSNETVSRIVSKNPDLFVGFASVDPCLGDKAVDELLHAVRDLGLQGVKLNPSLQGFDPLSSAAEKIYEIAERLEIPLLVHAGIVWSPKFSLRWCNPLVWDEVARRHPNLKIIIAHFGWPWVWEVAVVAMRNENVYIDTSNTFTGTPGEHLKTIFTEVIPSRVIERFLSKKIVFGSDYPRIEVDKMVYAVKSLPINPDIIERILYENARQYILQT